MKGLRREDIRQLSLALSFVVALSIAIVAYAPITLPLVYVGPEENVANPSESFTINVNIQDATDVFSWGLKLYFNPNVLEVTSVMEGPFLKEGTTSPMGTAFVFRVFSDYIDAACTTLGAYPGVSGSGTLFNATFHVKDAGTSDLDIVDSALLDPSMTSRAHDTASGYFYTTARADLVRRSAWPEHHHFVASKDEDFNGTHANQTLYAKVKNLGPINLYVYVSFEIVRDDGYVASVSTEVVVVGPDTIADLSADFTVNSTDAGKYAVSAKVMYSWSGNYYAQGEKTKSFSFAVVLRITKFQVQEEGCL